MTEKDNKESLVVMVRYTKRLPKLTSYGCKASSFAAEPNFSFYALLP